MEIQRFTLSNAALPLKTLFSGYLLVVGLGLLFAGGQIMLTHGMADGKLGLSVDDIVYSYYGNREEGSKLVSKLNGSMKDNAPPEVRLAMIKWAETGASPEQWDNRISMDIDQYCQPCHANISGLPDLSNKDAMKKLLAVDEGQPMATLTRVSHIHLFGISFIFFFVGWIFTYSTGIAPMHKAILISVPFGFLIVDVLAWWLTKLHPGFAWFVIIGGFGYSMAAAVMIFTSLYQMWILPLRKNHPVYPPADAT
ncbi:elongation factor-1 alpha [Sideroxydans sp.]